MKALHTLFVTALATVFFSTFALILTGCQQAEIEPVPQTILPTSNPSTKVYSINPNGAFDRAAIQNSPSAKPETFKIQGRESTLDLSEAFLEEDGALEALPGGAVMNIGLEEAFHSTEISVLKAMTCKSVSHNVPKDASSTFFKEDGRVWMYSQIALPAGKYGWISHVWKLEGVEMGRSEILVEGPSYRCSSYKTICESCLGNWTVDVVTENGEVLESVAFEVMQANL